MNTLNKTQKSKERPLKGIDLGLALIGYKYLKPAKQTKKSA